jgi:histidine triad (HIT) family protein
MKDPECIFCKIIEGKIPSAKLYEDKEVFCFLDISPVNKGHALIIPKRHYENMLDMPEASIAHCYSTAKKVAQAMMEGVRCDGFNVTMNNYPAAGQVVMHSHIHVIPRFESDGLKHWPQGRYDDDEEREEIRSSIAERMPIK